MDSKKKISELKEQIKLIEQQKDIIYIHNQMNKIINTINVNNYNAELLNLNIKHSKYKYNINITRKYIKLWKDNILLKKIDNCSIKKNIYESWNGSNISIKNFDGSYQVNIVLIKNSL